MSPGRPQVQEVRHGRQMCVCSRILPPSPSGSPTFPISVKGVVLDSADRVLLLKNERDAWELPGGRIEFGETPEECVTREILE
jgi:8-oxo-dGTP pyrophosphatase MutT (NUDIX family)